MLPDTPTPTRPLTVAYVGNYRAPWCTEVHVADTLEALGHTVHRLQEDELNAGTLMVQPAHRSPMAWRDVPDQLDAICADLLLWTRTWASSRPDDQRQALDVLAERGVATAAYHLDLYLGTVRENQITDEPWWGSQHLFTPDQRLDADERTVGRHHWLPPAVYAPECVVGTPRPEYVAQVGFVGTLRGYHPEWTHRQELAANLQRRYGRRYGRWPRGNQPVRGQALNDLYATVDVAVGDSYGAGTIPGYWSDRIPETLGRGGVLVHPEVPGLADCYDLDAHLATWRLGDWDGLYATVDALLGDPERRRQMRHDAMAHVLAHHTYTVRLQQLLGYLADEHPELGTDTQARPVAPAPPSPPPAPVIDATRVVRVGAARIELGLRHGTTDAEVFREVWDLGAYNACQPYLPHAGVLDVGANVGAFTLWALAKGARQVYAYEPEPGNHARLVENTARLPERLVQRHQLAVGAEVGELLLAPGPNDMHGGGTHLAIDADGPGVVKVSVTPIDQVLRSAIDAAGGELGVWKMDVEGAEYGIVRALDGGLLAHVRCIVMEFHGPGMPHLTHLGGATDVGPLVAKLAEYGRVDVMGRPSVGGTITWKRY